MNSSTNLRKPGKFVNAPVMKKDAMALVTGKPVYMDDEIGRASCRERVSSPV